MSAVTITITSTEQNVTVSGANSVPVFPITVVVQDVSTTPGRGIASTSYDGLTGILTITFTDGATFETGDLRGTGGGGGGADGRGIASTAYNEATGILTITFTDATTFATGDLRGAVGPAGPAGADSTVPGPVGPAGAAGVGVPVGGASGQILAKATAANYDTAWIDAPSGGGGSNVVTGLVVEDFATVQATTFDVVPGMQLAVPAGAVFYVWYNIIHSSDAADDLNFNFVVTGGPVNVLSPSSLTSGSSPLAAFPSLLAFGVGSGALRGYTFCATITGGAASGTIDLGMKKAVLSTPNIAKIHAGSNFVATRI